MIKAKKHHSLAKHIETLEDIKSFLENDGDWETRLELADKMDDIIMDIEDYVSMRERQMGDSFGH